MSKAGATSAIAGEREGLPGILGGLDIERDSFRDSSRIGVLEEREEIGSGRGVEGLTQDGAEIGLGSEVEGLTRDGAGIESVTISEVGKESKGS